MTNLPFIRKQKMPVALHAITDIVSRSEQLQEILRERMFEPSERKELTKRFTISETARLVGRTRQAIMEAEERGDLPPPEKDPKTNRRIGYSLAEIQYMRQQFRTLPTRSPKEDEPMVLAIQNFKGGVGKSTIAVHLAQYLSRQGYRILLIDCDSQASATSTFGYWPDYDLTEDETLLSFFEGKQRTLRYAVRDTYWDNLKLIPANLGLYTAEYFLAAKAASLGKRGMSSWLRQGIEEIYEDYDVVILDSPPALGMIALNVLYAATGLIVPMQPGMYDFASTVQFFRMLEEVIESVDSALEYHFLKIIISRKKERKSEDNKQRTTQDDISELARTAYGNFLLNNVLYQSAQIETAAGMLRTVYELDEPVGSVRTHKRAVEMLDATFGEIEALIRMTWPSHERQKKSA